MHALLACVCAVTQSCMTLWDPMDCSPPGSSAHRISQVRILEWVAIFPPRGIFLIQGSNTHLLHLLRWQADSLPLHCLGSLCFTYSHRFLSSPLSLPFISHLGKEIHLIIQIQRLWLHTIISGYSLWVFSPSKWGFRLQEFSLSLLSCIMLQNW